MKQHIFNKMKFDLTNLINNGIISPGGEIINVSIISGVSLFFNQREKVIKNSCFLS